MCHQPSTFWMHMAGTSASVIPSHLWKDQRWLWRWHSQVAWNGKHCSCHRSKKTNSCLATKALTFESKLCWKPCDQFVIANLKAQIECVWDEFLEFLVQYAPDNELAARAAQATTIDWVRPRIYMALSASIVQEAIFHWNFSMKLSIKIFIPKTVSIRIFKLYVGGRRLYSFGGRGGGLGQCFA